MSTLTCTSVLLLPLLGASLLVTTWAWRGPGPYFLASHPGESDQGGSWRWSNGWTSAFQFRNDCKWGRNLFLQTVYLSRLRSSEAVQILSLCPWWYTATGASSSTGFLWNLFMVWWKITCTSPSYFLSESILSLAYVTHQIFFLNIYCIWPEYVIYISNTWFHFSLFLI